MRLSFRFLLSAQQSVAPTPDCSCSSHGSRLKFHSSVRHNLLYCVLMAALMIRGLTTSLQLCTTISPHI
jgi:hypothetical protein